MHPRKGMLCIHVNRRVWRSGIIYPGQPLSPPANPIPSIQCDCTRGAVDLIMVHQFIVCLLYHLDGVSVHKRYNFN